MLVLAFCFGTLAARLIPGFICKFLYIYAVSKCIFMQYVMINRKLVGISGFLACLQERPILLLCAFPLTSCSEKSAENINRNEKAAFLPFLLENVRFCRK